MNDNLVEAFLRGGPRNGEVVQLPHGTTSVSFPSVRLRDNQAEPISPDTVKRHSWDEDALIINFDRYQLAKRQDRERSSDISIPAQDGVNTTRCIN